MSLVSGGTDALLEMRGWGQRQSGFRFDLLSLDLNVMGTLDVLRDRPPTVENNIHRTIKRTLSGLVLPPSVTAEINTLTERVRPSMILQNGAEYPLGVFLFADASRTRHTFSSAQFATPGVDGLYTEASMADQTLIADVETGRSYGYPPNSLVRDGIIDQLDQLGIVDYVVDASGSKIRGSEWVTWPADAKHLQIINDLAQLGGYYSLFFDNAGVARVQQVPDLEATPAELVYGPGGTVLADSITESDDNLELTNRWCVRNNALGDTKVFGCWALPPSAPNSFENRGRYITKVIDMQGVENDSDAAAAAKAIGQADRQAYSWVTFDAAPDPRHDTFQIIEWLGVKYHEQNWALPLREGGPHRHELRRIWSQTQ